MSRSSDEFTVLHVDDDPQLLELSQQFLRDEDDRLVVETMTDPVAAVERIQAVEYDAVVSDYQMPELNGLEVLERVRDSEGHALPIIMFTGKGREAVASEALNLGADRYLQKGGDLATQYTVLADAIVHEIEHTTARTTLQEYVTAVEASDDSIYMLDPDGEYVFANREHLTRLVADGKIDRAEEGEVVGRTYASIHPGPDTDRTTDILNAVCASGESKTEEYAFETEDTWSYRTYSPVDDPETGEQLGVVVISKDITQRKRMEERESFLSSLLRHDVKNKIHTADGYLDLIDDSDCSPETRDHLETATRALSGSLELIEQISTLSAVAQEEVGVWDLQCVLDDVVDSHASQAAAEGVDLSYDGCEGDVHGGPLLEALFGNLITNALKHSNADTIEVRCRREDEAYVVVVADDGDGLPTETAAQLLEEGVSKGESAGTGLGLYLVDQIAQSYGGHIELSDSDGGGLRVAVHLQAA